MTPHRPPLQVSCPTCKKQVIWCTDNPFRPFCSERCKSIDLGVWANEGYSIAGEEETSLLEEIESSGL